MGIDIVVGIGAIEVDMVVVAISVMCGVESDHQFHCPCLKINNSTLGN
jgi:hypothetical protein